jgi:hypothetical protein
MYLLAFIEWLEIHGVACHEDEAVLYGPPNDRPVLA